VEELLAKNKSMESFVTSLEVKIRHTEVILRHKFVPGPLVYSRETMSRDFQEMERERVARGNLPIAGQSFNSFMAYNARVNDLV
jgi:hypothetical protein